KISKHYIMPAIRKSTIMNLCCYKIPVGLLGKTIYIKKIIVPKHYFMLTVSVKIYNIHFKKVSVNRSEIYVCNTGNVRALRIYEREMGIIAKTLEYNKGI